MAPRRTEGSLPRRAAVLAALVAIAASAFDPAARGADPKRVTLLVSGFGFAAWTWTRARARGGSSGLPAPIVLAGVFVAASLASWAWGEPRGFETAAPLTSGALLVLAARGLPATERVYFTRMAATLTGVLAGVIALGELLVRGRALVHGGQGNPDWLGLLLAVTLPVTVEFAWVARSRWKALVLSAAALEALVLLLSESRSGWIAAMVGLAVIAFGRLTGAATLAGAGVGALVLGTSRIAEAAGPAGFHDRDAGLALSGRLYLARESAEVALRGAPFGVGLGGFHRAFLVQQGRSLAKLPPEAQERAFLNADHAHADWIEVLAESGIVAFAALAAGALLAARSLFRARFFGGAGAIVAFSVLALADTPLRQPSIVMVLALVLACVETPAEGRRERPSWAPPAFLVPALVVAMGAWCTSLSARAWLSTRLVTHAESAPLDAKRALLARAERIDPGNGEATLAKGLLELANGDFEAADASLARSTATLPNVGTLIAMGNARMGAGRIDLAVAAYDEALRMHPGSLRAHTNLGEALLARGDLDGAGAHAKIARRLSPGHPKVVELGERVQARIYAREVGEE